MKEIHKDFGAFETKNGYKVNGKMEILETEETFPITVPPYAIRETILPPNAAIYTVENFRFIEEKEKRIMRLNFENNEIIGYFKTSINYRMFIRFALKWLLIKVLENKGISFIHGSGVEKDGSSFFFVGPSGSGKTHTLIAFLLAGYKLITDDIILVKEGKVIPFHLRSKILNNMIIEMPFLKKGLTEKSSQLLDVGWHIDLADIFTVQKKQVYPSKLFYIYVWNASETQIEAIPKKEMLSRLFHIYQNELSNSIWFNHDIEESMKKIFTNYEAFVQKVDCFKVYAGKDVVEFINEVQETINED
jgi:hypothetical protein